MDYSGAQHSSPPLVCIRRHTLYTLSLDGHGLLCVQRRVKLSSSDRPTPSSDRLHALLVLTRSYTVFAPSLTQPGHAARSHQTPSHLCTNGHHYFHHNLACIRIGDISCLWCLSQVRRRCFIKILLWFWKEGCMTGRNSDCKLR